MPSKFDALSERLVIEMVRAGHSTLQIVGEELAERIRRDIPVGDPSLDPDPGFTLRDHVVVRAYGKYVSVAVEGPYAVKQHESFHLRHPRGGGPKFVEKNAIHIAQLWQRMLAGSVQHTFAHGPQKSTNILH